MKQVKRKVWGLIAAVQSLTMIAASCSFEISSRDEDAKKVSITVVLGAGGSAGSNSRNAAPARLLLSDAKNLTVGLTRAGQQIEERSSDLTGTGSEKKFTFTVLPGESYGITATARAASGGEILYKGSGSFTAGTSAALSVYLLPYREGGWPSITQDSAAFSLDLPAGGRTSVSVRLGGRPLCVLPSLSGVDVYAQNADGSPVSLTSLSEGLKGIRAADLATPADPVLLTFVNSSGPAYSGFAATFKFSNFLTVVYDSASSTDTTYAEGLKAILESDVSALSGVSGTDNFWAVTLLPQTDIPTTMNADYTGFGDGGFIVLSAYSGLGAYPASGATTDQKGRLQNVLLFAGRLVAMGNAVAAFDVIAANYAAWGFSGTMPLSLGWGPSAITPGANQLAATAHSAWSAPFSLAATPAAGDPVDWSTETSSFVSVYLSGGTPPSSGEILAGDYAGGSNYYPVVSQGYFLQFGIPALPSTDAGKAFLRNAFSWLRDLDLGT